MIKLDSSLFSEYINKLVEQEINSVNESFAMQQKRYNDALIYLQDLPNKISDYLKEYNRLASTLNLSETVATELIENVIVGKTNVTSSMENKEEPVEELNNNISRVKIPKSMSFKNCALTQNTLIISELTKTVKLPYTFKELRKILIDPSNNFVSMREIVRTLYTKPLSSYKSPSIARFKEGFNLIRKKEKGSIGDALELGFELFSNYNLHPSIIAACKNLNELDVYLSCLEYNELQDFPFFKVIFNISPAISKPAVIKRTITKKKRVARHLID